MCVAGLVLETETPDGRMIERSERTENVDTEERNRNDHVPLPNPGPGRSR